MVTPNFLFGYQTHLLSLLFPNSFKLCKNIPVLVGTTHKKPSIMRCAEHMRSNNSRHHP